MSEAFTRILNDARDFSAKIEECCRATTFNAADYRDAYGRLGRLRERYLHEKRHGTLDRVEEEALCKVFEKDVFIEGMLDGRQISEHIQKRSGGEPDVRLTTNSPIPLTAETSAGSYFAGPIFTVRGPQGQVHYVDHLRQLQEAERRIQHQIDRAMTKQAPPPIP